MQMLRDKIVCLPTHTKLTIAIHWYVVNKSELISTGGLLVGVA